VKDLALLIPKILAEIRAAWRFRWYGAAIAWSFCLLGWGVVALMPNVYEASATLYVDTASVLRPILTNQIVPPDVIAELTYVNQALFGREHLERVARENQLDTLSKTPAEFDRLLDRLRRTITVESRPLGGAGSSILATLKYRNSDRDKAIGVVTTFVNSLVDGTIGGTKRDTDTASQFLEERIGAYETRLQEAEQALADFKKRNADRLPGAEGGYFQRISTMREGIENVQNQLRLAESRAARLRAQLSSSAPVVPSGVLETPPPPNSIDARIRDQETELNRLLLTFTDRHPDVIAAREALNQLMTQRAQQLRAVGIVDPHQELSSLDANPVYQALQVALNETEVEIDTLRADLRNRDQKLKELQALVDEVPEVEAELARLNRDYDVVHAQYQALTRSRETQDLSEKASDSDQVEFRVINPPLSAYEPVAPDRVIFLSAVFVFALGAGGIVCWLMSQTRPVFTNAFNLQQICGLPVLGVVSKAFDSRDRVRRMLEFVRFASATGVLAALYMVGVLLEIAGPGLDMFVRQG
jgi:polysaccharide chain length determinant protein (PEP-CTERM system associated)